VLLLAFDLRADHQEVENDDQADREQQTKQLVAGGRTAALGHGVGDEKAHNESSFVPPDATNASGGDELENQVWLKFSRAL
jgi:hypothetical protein